MWYLTAFIETKLGIFVQTVSSNFSPWKAQRQITNFHRSFGNGLIFFPLATASQLAHSLPENHMHNSCSWEVKMFCFLSTSPPSYEIVVRDVGPSSEIKHVCNL